MVGLKVMLLCAVVCLALAPAPALAGDDYYATLGVKNDATDAQVSIRLIKMSFFLQLSLVYIDFYFYFYFFLKCMLWPYPSLFTPVSSSL